MGSPPLAARTQTSAPPFHKHSPQKSVVAWPVAWVHAALQWRDVPQGCPSLENWPPSNSREYIDVAPAFTTWNATERRAEVGGLAKHEEKARDLYGAAPDVTPRRCARSLLPGGTPALLTKAVGGDVSTPELRQTYSKRVGSRADKVPAHGGDELLGEEAGRAHRQAGRLPRARHEGAHVGASWRDSA